MKTTFKKQTLLADHWKSTALDVLKEMPDLLIPIQTCILIILFYFLSPDPAIRYHLIS
jgi:hypothetical protein